MLGVFVGLVWLGLVRFLVWLGSVWVWLGLVWVGCGCGCRSLFSCNVVNDFLCKNINLNW